jgi:membrane fusion protein (multidrug efflux system)
MRLRRFTPAILLPFLVASLTTGCGKPQPPGGESKPLPVTVLAMQPQNLPVILELMAQTEGAKETEVRARVGGILLKRLYEEGAPVKAGQPLFQIDRAPYENALADAQAKAEQTAREAARLKGLLAHQAISQREHDDAVSVNAVAQANLQQARLNLSWTTVAAPVGGISGRAIKSEGNLIGVGDASPLTSIFQSNPIWVRFGLAESDLARLPGGVLKSALINRIELILPNGQTYPKPGKLNFLASTIDTVLGTQQARAEFDNANGGLLPGQFVRVRLSVGERQGVFLVPQSAVVQTDKGRLVMLAGADNKVTPRPIETAEWQGKDWVVTKGLNAGDKVIVDNLIKLRPGAPVAPQAPQSQTGTSPSDGHAVTGKPQA